MHNYDLPPELQEEHVDALIIFSKDSDDDQERAERLRDDIQGLTFENGITGKAVFLDDAVPYVTSHIDRLDEAVKFATLIFVIYSKTLNDDPVILRNAQAILWHTIEAAIQRRGSFIPVIHGEQTSESLHVRLLQPINTSLSNWKGCLKNTIKCHLQERLRRMDGQEIKQQEFWESQSSTAFNSNTTTSRPEIEPSVHPVCNGNLNQGSAEDDHIVEDGATTSHPQIEKDYTRNLNQDSTEGVDIISLHEDSATTSCPQIESSVLSICNGNPNQESTEDVDANGNAVEGNKESVDDRRATSPPQIEPSVLPVYNGNPNQESAEDVDIVEDGATTSHPQIEKDYTRNLDQDSTEGVDIISLHEDSAPTSCPQIESSVLSICNGNTNEESTEDVDANGNAVEGNDESVDDRRGWHNRFVSLPEGNLASVVGVGGIAVFVLLISLSIRQRV